MTRYGQFCPVAKATEILGDQWTLLIVRELLLGTTRFSGFQRAISRISPTILNKRLKALEANGVIVKRSIAEQKGGEYRLTAAGRELGDLIDNLAVWGMRWARNTMDDDEMDVGFLMFDVQRRINTTALPDGQNVICFTIRDLAGFNNWWIMAEGETVDLCYEDPGKDVDLFVSAEARDIISVWMGDIDLRSALRSETIKLVGDKHLMRTFADWFARSSAADVPRPDLEQLAG